MREREKPGGKERKEGEKVSRLPNSAARRRRNEAAISSRGNEGSRKEIVLSPFGEQSELSTPLEAVEKKNKGKERTIVSPDEIEKFKKRKHEKEPSGS